MRKTVYGNRYNFLVLANDCMFYIRALDKLSLRYSHINNLNSVLSELGVDAEKEKFGDSFWNDLSRKEVQKFWRISVDFLSDRKFRNYVEEKLDEDQLCGEWENSLADLIK